MTQKHEKNIEIELRGPLNADQRERLKKLFASDGSFVCTKDRVLIDYSTFIPGQEIEGRNKDIRIRCTNGIPEIVVKLGAWGGADSRTELSFKGAPGSFDELARIMGALGYSKGVLCVRKSEVYMYKDIEFALVEVPGHSMYFEAELLGDATMDKKELSERIRAVCRELGLEIFSDKDYFAYIKSLNEESNEVFDFASYSPGYFKERFGI